MLYSNHGTLGVHRTGNVKSDERGAGWEWGGVIVVIKSEAMPWTLKGGQGLCKRV